ncbi:MAG: hypothetical protein ABI585_07780 [Betaproteobacteria bacterium]
MPTSKSTCPSCKQMAGVNIAYGYPSPEGHEKAARGEIVFGGCIVRDDAPERACTHCGHRWSIERGPTLQDPAEAKPSPS